ncbi:PEP-CTERM sorting domain-containing protein [Massilia sp. TN1-12]|uniref:PEP-CTERM sorting domain-containing protein n=1 Tax=Massilia paldalensis TaxID=3377675 RepID=UPI00384CA139
MRIFLGLMLLAGMLHAHAAHAQSVTVGTTSSGIVYRSDIDGVFDGTVLDTGTPYVLDVKATFDMRRFNDSGYGSADANLAWIDATFDAGGTVHAFHASGLASFFFSRDASFSDDRVFLSWAASIPYGGSDDRLLGFVHTFEVPFVFFPSEHLLDPADITFTHATQRETTIVLHDTFSSFGAVYMVPTSLTWQVTSSPTSPVPEPGAGAMLVAGAGVLFVLRKRRGAQGHAPGLPPPAAKGATLPG